MENWSQKQCTNGKPDSALKDCEHGGGEYRSNAGNVAFVPSVDALLRLSVSGLASGTTVRVGGYREDGDGGGKWVRYAEDSRRADNGGTVHNPHGVEPCSGRWETVHEGTADFRWFGIFDATVDADDALEAMVADRSISRIEVHTDLNFARRHIFDRSHIEIDFNGHTVTTCGIELNSPDNPFGAVLFFRGLPCEERQTIVLTENIAELTDLYEVADSAGFAAGEWWLARVSPLSGGAAQRELDYMLKVTEIVDPTHVRFNYKLGWSIGQGREISYQKVNPVVRSCVRDMKFVGVPVPPTSSAAVRPFETWDCIGSHPVAYEFAVECDVSDIRAEGVFWPVIMRRYCSHYVTERCELINPVQRDWGGTGYLTQQIHVLYGHVRDCNTSNARHLNDFTNAGYCMVENCHNDGDDYGPFVTHGQFEHDLLYIGNSGLLSFANSGSTWGDSAKRITVQRHVASRIVAHKKLTDLTLEDCHAYYKEGMEDSGTIWANLDGLVMKGCTADRMVTLSRSSELSKRNNVIDSCGFAMAAGGELARPIREGTEAIGYRPVNGSLHISNSRFDHVEDVLLGSIDRLTLDNTWFTGLSGTAGVLRIGCKQLFVHGGGFKDCGFELTGRWDLAASGGEEANAREGQTVVVDSGTSFNGSNGRKAFMQQAEPGNHVIWNIGNITSVAADAEMAHIRIQAGTNEYRAVGASFTGGRLVLEEAGFGEGSYMLHTSCVERHVDRTVLPAQCDSVRHMEGNLILT
ncbi:peptidase C14 [Paenibacillus ginsengarvi]|uniref:Peptidase C14 n=1 Tax=Paenibacillus ginsengarvi TaxID=400777 RepID=A0A3B0BIM7_9BACL|nr:peptidase C14 [Paenibacillus ginsengarvi]RKN72464.1 peptidase C14 [Paenibacillus ginsengarvi]